MARNRPVLGNDRKPSPGSALRVFFFISLPDVEPGCFVVTFYREKRNQTHLVDTTLASETRVTRVTYLCVRALITRLSCTVTSSRTSAFSISFLCCCRCCSYAALCTGVCWDTSSNLEILFISVIVICAHPLVYL